MIKDFITKVESFNILNLNTITYGNPYDVLNNEEINYSACVIELIGSSISGSITNYNFRISILDKLNEDESNLLDIYDNATRQLTDLIVNIQNQGYEINQDFSINYVEQDFADKLAGIYAEITVYDETYYCKYYD